MSDLYFAGALAAMTLLYVIAWSVLVRQSVLAVDVGNFSTEQLSEESSGGGDWWRRC
jgi:hypothetical protein